jgi:hypothetical protein
MTQIFKRIVGAVGPTLGAIIGGYLVIGGLLGFLLMGSYFWFASTVLTWCVLKVGIAGLLPVLMALMMTMLMAFLGFFMRSFLWLPSLVDWYFNGPESFLSWLMPGLYGRCGGWGWMG